MDLWAQVDREAALAFTELDVAIADMRWTLNRLDEGRQHAGDLAVVLDDVERVTRRLKGAVAKAAIAAAWNRREGKE